MFTECFQFKRTCSSNLGHSYHLFDMSYDDEAKFRSAARFRSIRLNNQGHYVLQRKWKGNQAVCAYIWSKGDIQVQPVHVTLQNQKPKTVLFPCENSFSFCAFNCLCMPDQSRSKSNCEKYVTNFFQDRIIVCVYYF